MRVLLTGSTGFIGAHVLRALLRLGLDVHVLMRPQASPWRFAAEMSRVTVAQGDLCDTLSIGRVLAIIRPEVVCHLAWGGVAGALRNDPIQIRENLPASLALVDACLEHGVARFVGMGSQAEYGPLDKIIAEDMPARPTTLYGGAKLSVCTLAQIQLELANASFAWLRLFSTFGPQDEPHWLIPSVILRLLRRERPSLTAATQRWDYLYVEDLAEAVASVVTTPSARGIFNLGSGDAFTVRHIVETIRDLIDPALPLGFGEVPFRADQVMHLQADIRKLTGATGWQPVTSLDQGLEKTIRWFHGSQL